MLFLVEELSATLIASLFLLSLLACSGAFFASALRFPGFAGASGLDRLGLSLLCALACLPALLDLAGRAGPWPMTFVALAFAALGGGEALRALRDARGVLARTAPWPAVWSLAVAALLVDWPTPGGLRHATPVVDYVKHAAATWAIEASGTPPFNPTLYAPGGHAAYYYFFYTLTAADALALQPLGVVARHAAYAGAVAMGPALLALAWTVSSRAGADDAAGADERRAKTAGLVVALLLTTGLDILPTFALAGLRGDFRLGPEDWNEQVTSWLSSVLWVPHHLAGLCAAMAGLIALTRDPADRAGPNWRRVLFAGLAFASMAGLSIYVAMAGAATAAVWTLTLAVRRRRAEAAAAVAAGLLSLLVAGPWLRTILARAETGVQPAALAVRKFPLADALLPEGWLRVLADLALMPVGYALEFGVFAIGAVVFWRRAGRAGAERDLGAVLVIAAASSFLIGSFVRSTILFNDLGWRVMLFAQLATLVWTLAAWRAGAFARGRLRRIGLACLWLGYLAGAHAVVYDRADPLDLTPARANLADEIAAWRWLDARLPALAVVQENPGKPRAFSYGLYGRFPEAVSDRDNSRLFGGDEALVQSRLADIAPLFADPSTSPDAVRAVAARYGLSAIVVAAPDPVFAAPNAWPQKLAPDFSNAHARVYLFGAAAGAAPR